ncbi:hypothetical protein [Halapricum desulfuricans]|uniref:hypothetical protein n=1 Tax=Halapricum desulfuricans TaxID=2841257 RepID=UPI001E4EF9D6|nr:hypothetical protein [Halapricum desulfuricans]
MSERIDISRVEVINIERSPNNPFSEKWTGSLRMEGSEFTFTTNIELKEGKKYRVVWERTEPRKSEQMFIIHKVVNNGS